MAEQKHDLRGELAALAARIERLEQRIGLEPEPPAETLNREPDRSPSPVRPPLAIDTLMLERLVGGRWFAAIGSIVVVIGLGLFLKLAIDEGWLARIPPAMKCWAVAGFGLALLGAGEILRRRSGALASAGPSATGVAAIYAAGYSAYGIYQLLQGPSAFALLAAVSVLGVAIAARARLASVAILSLIGAYASPFLFTSVRSAPLLLPFYLLAVLGVGLVLSGWMRGFFVRLRLVVWCGTALFGTSWIVTRGLDQVPVALTFLMTAWVAMHLELLLASMVADPGGVEDGDKNTLEWGREAVAVGSWIVSAWAVILAGVVLWSWLGRLDWLAPALGAVVTLSCAILAGDRLKVFRRLPGTVRGWLAAGLATQGGALAVAFIWLALTGWVEVTVYFGLGLAAVVAGRLVRANSLATYGLLVSSFGVLRLITLEYWLVQVAPDGIRLAGLYLTPWSLLVGLGVLTWLFSGWLLRQEEFQRRKRATLANGIGFTLLLASILHEHTQAPSLCFAWIALSGTAALVGSFQRLIPWGRLALLGMAACLGVWAIAYPLKGWAGFDALPGLHPGLLVALVLAAGTGAVLIWLTPRRDESPVLARTLDVVATTGVVLLLWGATSLEVARATALLTNSDLAQAAVVSIWWGMFGVGLITIGFLTNSAISRDAGLLLVLAALVKVTLYDLADIPPEWRVISFVGLGLLMLGVAVTYARIFTRFLPQSRSVEQLHSTVDSK